MSTPLLEKALGFATAAHAGQTRKHARGDLRLPYVVHPVEVLKTLWDWGTVDEVVGPAALLHDVLEDTLVLPSVLEREFGSAVYYLVRELTLAPDEDKDSYIKAFKDPDQKSVRALVIKAADRVCNTRDFVVSDRAYAAKYLRKAEPLFEALLARQQETIRAFGTGIPNPVVADYSALRRSLGL